MVANIVFFFYLHFTNCPNLFSSRVVIAENRSKRETNTISQTFVHVMKKPPIPATCVRCASKLNSMHSKDTYVSNFESVTVHLYKIRSIKII